MEKKIITLEDDNIILRPLYKHDQEERNIFKNCIVDHYHEGYYVTDKNDDAVFGWFCVNTDKKRITDIGINTRLLYKYNLDYILLEMIIYTIDNYNIKNAIYRYKNKNEGIADYLNMKYFDSSTILAAQSDDDEFIRVNLYNEKDEEVSIIINAKGGIIK